jgi:Fe-S-cluster containining protein
MQITKLGLEDILPLTCSRAGVCCHGNVVMLNPWELYSLAKEKKMAPQAFRDLYCELGGAQLNFDGEPNAQGKKACNQYVENFGCSVHVGRPLACRLYPIGRQIQNNSVQYMHQGTTFPCLSGCAEVLNLPKLTVGDYLKGQATEKFETAQDAYLELMQNIADMAFEFLLDTDLAASGDKKTISLWRKMGKETPSDLIKRIGAEWLDNLFVPDLGMTMEDPIEFVQKHSEFLQDKVQEKFGTATTRIKFHEASVLLMGLALQLARGLGADPESLAEHWSDTANEHGAKG